MCACLGSQQIPTVVENVETFSYSLLHWCLKSTFQLQIYSNGVIYTFVTTPLTQIHLVWTPKLLIRQAFLKGCLSVEFGKEVGRVREAREVYFLKLFPLASTSEVSCTHNAHTPPMRACTCEHTHTQSVTYTPVHHPFHDSQVLEFADCDNSWPLLSSGVRCGKSLAATSHSMLLNPYCSVKQSH